MKLTGISIKRYNNKSRRGEYVVMRGKNGRKTWKIQPGVTLDGYAEAYERGLTRQEAAKQMPHLFTADKKAREQRNAYIKQLKARGELSPAFKRGSSKVKTTLDRLATPGGQEAAYKALFGKLIMNKHLYDVVRKNVKDLRPYLAYQVRLEGKSGPIGEFFDTGRYDIQQLVAQYRGKLKYRKGTEIPFPSEFDAYAEKSPLKLDARQIKLNENNVHQWRGGVIQNVAVTIHFRK